MIAKDGSEVPDRFSDGTGEVSCRCGALTVGRLAVSDGISTSVQCPRCEETIETCPA